MSELAIKKTFNHLESQFVEMARPHKSIIFQNEINFACMILKNNSYLLGIAETNPDSMQAAVLNVAGAGISLNPIEKHAYLVPRRIDKKMAICLDVSYMGLIHMAVKTGSVLWCHSEVVRKQDSFEMKQINEMPLHKFSPFEERGPVIGVYCVAKLHDGSYMTRVMDMEKIQKIMESSEAYKAFKGGKTRQCPWVDYFDEMAKKTVIKQASKTWPKTDVAFKTVVDIINQHEGIDFNGKEERIEYNPIDYYKRFEQVEKVTSLLGELCEGYTATQKISFMEDKTGFKNYQDIKIQDNESLDKIIKTLVMEKTSRAVDDGNKLPYTKEDQKDKEDVKDLKTIEAELVDKKEVKTEKRTAKDVKFTIN